MREQYLIQEGHIRALPDERIVATLRLESGRQALYLTNWRLIYSGWDRFLKVIPIPGEQIRQIALLQDVDYVGTTISRLPVLLLLLGIAIAIGGFAVVGGGGGILLGFIGLAIVAGWLFVKSRVLRFTVSGAEHFEYHVVQAVTGTGEIEDFLNKFFEEKFRLSREAVSAPERQPIREEPPVPEPEPTPESIR